MGDEEEEEEIRDDAEQEISAAEDKLDTRATMRLSAEFCLLWFFVRPPLSLSLILGPG